MKISFAGDLTSEGRINSIIETGIFEPYFLSVKQYLLNSDYSIVNLECPICDRFSLPIPKCGPSLMTSPKIVDLVKYLNFNGVCLANNHIADYGDDGIHNTQSVLKESNIDYVGIGDSIDEASSPLYITKGNDTLACFNCCEHEFSIVEKGKAGAAPINPIKLSYSIKDAKRQCKYVVVIVHGGCEHYNLPTNRMTETYRFFVDCGADAVINHHQHCYSGYEVYNGKPIFYGLGNFCFDANDSSRKLWNRGLLVTIDFNNAITFDIRPYIQNEEQLGVYLCERESDEYLSIMKDIERLSQVIVSPSDLDRAFDSFEDSTKTFYKKALEPYSNYYTRALFEKGFLPSFLSKEKKKLLYNIIACESHRERLIRSLSEDIK